MSNRIQIGKTFRCPGCQRITAGSGRVSMELSGLAQGNTFGIQINLKRVTPKGKWEPAAACDDCFVLLLGQSILPILMAKGLTLEAEMMPKPSDAIILQ